MIGAVADILSAVLILAGAGFFLTGAIGYLRMPDLFTRLHAASLADTTGMALILAGLAVHAGFGLVAVKLVFLILFLLFMGPAATHALAAAALASGLKPPGDARPAAAKAAAPGPAAAKTRTGQPARPAAKSASKSATKPRRGRR